MRPPLPRAPWHSPRWPAWPLLVFYALLCSAFLQDFTPRDPSAPGLPGTLHQRIVSFAEPSTMQYRWFLPLLAEGVRRLTGCSEPAAYRFLVAATLWLLLVSYHLLLRRRFSPCASAAGAVLLLVAYLASHPSAYFHPYDPLVSLCLVAMIEAVFRRSWGWFVLGAAGFALLKGLPALSAPVLLAPAWLYATRDWRDRLAGVLGALAAVGVVVLAVHLPLVGSLPSVRMPGEPYYGGITTQEFLRLLLYPRLAAQSALYLLPALFGLWLGWPQLGGLWRPLLWLLPGTVAVGLAAQIVVWEPRTYFPCWLVLLPFLLAGLEALHPQNGSSSKVA